MKSDRPKTLAHPGFTPGLLLLLLLTLAVTAAQARPGQGGPQLGVVVQAAPFAKLESVGLPYGVVVRRVLPDSPAAAAGIQAGDILVEMEEAAIYSPARLQWLVGRAPAGEPLALRVQRDGETRQLEAKLRERAASPWGGHAEEPGIAFLGIGMTPLTEDLREQYGVESGRGVLVSEVEDGGPADEAGVQAGDVLVQIDRRKVSELRDVLRAVHYFDPGAAVDVTVVRDGESRTLDLTLGRAELPERPAAHGGYRGRHPWGSGMPRPMPPCHRGNRGMPPWHGGSMPHGGAMMPGPHGRPQGPGQSMPEGGGDSGAPGSGNGAQEGAQGV